jgi:hypothetical protein
MFLLLQKNGNLNSTKCSYRGIRNHEASECRKKKRGDDKDKNNTTDTSTENTSGGSNGSTTTKANVAIVKDNIIRSFDTSDDNDRPMRAYMARRNSGSWVAIPWPTFGKTV